MLHLLIVLLVYIPSESVILLLMSSWMEYFCHEVAPYKCSSLGGSAWPKIAITALIFQCSMDKTWCRLRKAFIVHIYEDNRPFYQLLNSSFLSSQLLQSLPRLYFIISCQYWDESILWIYSQTEKLYWYDWIKNQELETHFIYQQNDINFCLHTLMLKYVTPTSRNVRKQNNRLCSSLKRLSIYSNRNWFEVTLTVNFILGIFCLIWRNKLFILFCEIQM